jgi:hypothetical protein
VHRESSDVVSADLTLPGVQPGAHLNAERLHRLANCRGAPDGSLWAVERREETVSGGADFAAAEVSKLSPYDRVVCVEQRTPVAVALLRSATRRVHDVGEKDGERTRSSATSGGYEPEPVVVERTSPNRYHNSSKSVSTAWVVRRAARICKYGCKPRVSNT